MQRKARHIFKFAQYHYLIVRMEILACIGLSYYACQSWKHMPVKHAFVFCGQINWSLLYFLKAFARRKNQLAYLLNFLNGIFLICHVPGSKIHIKLNFLLSFHTVLKRLVRFSMFLVWYDGLLIWYDFGTIHCTSYL